MTVGKILYKYRSFTPLPLIIALLIFAHPGIITIIAGFLISLFGEILRLTSVAYTGLTTRSKNVQSNILVTDGPYGIVRNPIYMGNFLLSLGIVISAHTFFPWFIVIFVVLFAVQYFFIIRFEEKFLRETFKEEYETYTKCVPSFFPRFVSYSEGNSVEPNFRNAIRSEKTTITIVCILYVIVMGIHIAYEVIG